MHPLGFQSYFQLDPIRRGIQLRLRASGKPTNFHYSSATLSSRAHSTRAKMIENLRAARRQWHLVPPSNNVAIVIPLQSVAQSVSCRVRPKFLSILTLRKQKIALAPLKSNIQSHLCTHLVCQNVCPGCADRYVDHTAQLLITRLRQYLRISSQFGD